MIKQLLLLGSIILLITSFTLKKKKEFLPPGTVKINDTLFADETEVSNFSWFEYEFWIKEKYGYHSKEHIAALPDTLVWRDKSAYNEPYVQYYYRHPAYKNYPVVGVSYEQVSAFIQWRMERIKEYMCISKKYDIVSFEFRLPTKSEWEFLSNNGDHVFKNDGRNEKGMITFNHVWEPKDSVELKRVAAGHNGYSIENADVTAPVYAYWPNKFKLWNMIGNVSEMVLEKGISKGGSWRHRLEQCRVGKDITYEKPTAWLGFRCVCIVKKSNA
jgi:formylglycine-generating enzyme required for sulfatase activity